MISSWLSGNASLYVAQMVSAASRPVSRSPPGARASIRCRSMPAIQPSRSLAFHSSMSRSIRLLVSPSRTDVNTSRYSSTVRTCMCVTATALERIRAVADRLAASAAMSSHAVITRHRPVARSVITCALHRPVMSMSDGTPVLRNSWMNASMFAGADSRRAIRTPAPARGRLRRTKTGYVVLLDRHGAVQALGDLLARDLNGLLARGHGVEAVPVGRHDADAQVVVDEAGEAPVAVLRLDMRPHGSLQVAGRLAELGRVPGQHVHPSVHELIPSALSAAGYRTRRRTRRGAPVGASPAMGLLPGHQAYGRGVRPVIRVKHCPDGRTRSSSIERRHATARRRAELALDPHSSDGSSFPG